MSDSIAGNSNQQHPGELDAWLRFKLEQPDDVSPDDIRRALMDKIESGEFAIDEQLELASCLVSGRPHLAESEEFAVEAQLRRRVDDFNRHFFEFPPATRGAELNNILEAVKSYPALQMRLKHTADALHADARQVDALTGTTKKLAELILRTYVLPQPEQANARRQRVQDILKDAPGGQGNDNLEWRDAAGRLMKQCPGIARLDFGLLHSLGWNPHRTPDQSLLETKQFAGTAAREQPAGRRTKGRRRRFEQRDVFAFGSVTSVMLLAWLIATGRHGPDVDPSRTPPLQVPSIPKQPEFDPFNMARDQDVPLAVRSLLRDVRTGDLEELTLDEIERRFGADPQTSAIKARLTELVGPDGERPMSRTVLSLILPQLVESPEARIDPQTLPADAAVLLVETFPAEDGTGEFGYIVGVDGASSATGPEALEATIRFLSDYYGKSIHKTQDVALGRQQEQLESLLSYHDAHVRNGHVPPEDIQTVVRHFRGANVVMQARLLVLQNQETTALAIVEEGLDAVSDYPGLYALRAELRERLGQHRLVLADLERVIRLQPANGYARVRRASLLDRLGKSEQALQDCTEAIRLAPDDYRAWLQRGTTYIDIDREAAMFDLNAAIRLKSDSPAAWTHRGQLYRLEGKPTLGRNDVQQALAIDSAYAPAIREYGRILEDLGEFEAAHRELSRYLNIRGQDVDAWCDRARLRIRFEEYDGARRDLGVVSTLDPESARVHLLRGALLESNGELQAAVAALSRAIERIPENPAAWSQRADVLVKLERFDEALDDRETALGLAPENSHFLRLHGELLEQRAEYEFAIEDWNEYVRLFPNDSYGYFRRGYCWLQLDEWDRTIESAQQAIARGDNSAPVYHQIVQAHHRLGNLSEAVRFASLGIELNPSFVDILKTRSLIRAQQGRMEEALADITEALRVEPDNGAQFHVRGYIFEAQRKYTAALADYDRAVELEPGKSDHVARRAWLLAVCPDISIRDVERALVEAERSLTLKPVAWSRGIGHDALAAALAAQGEFETAVEQMKRGLEVANGIDDADAMRDRLKLYESRQAYVAPE